MKLKDLGDYFIGLTYKPESVTNEGTIVLRSGNIQGGKLDLSDIVRVNTNIREKQFVRPGDILMCSRNGSAKLVGKSTVIPDINEPMTFGAFMTVFRTPYNEYLRFFFQSDSFKKQLLSSKTTTINQITVNMLDSIDIELPEKSIRDERCAILNRIQKVINTKEEELSALDNLIYARFVEMFIGRDYPLISVGNLSLGKGEYGAQSASVKYDSNRPRYVRITDINDDGTLNDDVVSSSNVEDDKQYKLCYGDFLFARMGATVGKTYAYKEGNQIYAGYLIRYKLNLEQILPEYLFAFTKLNQYWSWVKLNQSGAAQPGINAKKYDSLQIPVAPMREQKAFQSFAAQIDKSKSVIQKSLDETQLLFDSLMQKYFG